MSEASELCFSPEKVDGAKRSGGGERRFKQERGARKALTTFRIFPHFPREMRKLATYVLLRDLRVPMEIFSEIIDWMSICEIGRYDASDSQNTCSGFRSCFPYFT